MYQTYVSNEVEISFFVHLINGCRSSLQVSNRKGEDFQCQYSSKLNEQPQDNSRVSFAQFRSGFK